MKKALITASLLLAVGTTAACGGGSDSAESASAPTDASKKDFCAVITDTDSDSTGKDIAAKLNKVGTPTGVSKDVRSGFELFVKNIAAFDSSPSDSELSKMQKDLDAADLATITAFITYVGTECAG